MIVGLKFLLLLSVGVRPETFLLLLLLQFRTQPQMHNRFASSDKFTLLKRFYTLLP
jgi:hypothetical protein